MQLEKLAIAEIFGPTFQGEGPSTGRRAFFVRLQGCNLTCSWCDTKFTWDPNHADFKNFRSMHIADVAEELRGLGFQWHDLLVITGGEPMLQANRIRHLLSELDCLHVEIETNGTIDPAERISPRQSVLVTYNVSPKLANAHNARAVDYRILRKYAMQGARFKFVITSEEDIQEVAEIVKGSYISPHNVWLMPEGTSPEVIEERLRWLAPLTLDQGWNLTSRMHVTIWRDERGR